MVNTTENPTTTKDAGKSIVPDIKGLPRRPDTLPRETKPKKSKTVQKILGYGLGGLMALEGIGATVTELTNDKPASITETLPEDLAHPYRLGLKSVEVIPSTFDPNAIEQMVGPENSTQMTFEEYEKIAPPVWEGESKTMTLPLPVIFRDGRIPTLHVEKVKNNIDGKLDVIVVRSGLEPGDIIFSPVDGEIVVFKGSENLGGFSLRFRGPDGEDVNMYIASKGLKPLINIDFEQLAKAKDYMIRIPIKKGDPIGSLLTADQDSISHSQLLIEGNGPRLDDFNLAVTSESKMVEITK